MARGIEPGFRFASKKIFLTYSQCDLTAEQIYDFLAAQGPIVYCIIARELHQDGNAHRHVLVEFEKRQMFRNPRKFDIDSYHPSIEKPRNWQASLNYCKKDGDYEEFGNDGRHSDEGIFDVARSCATWEDWVEYCLKHKIQFGFMEAIWKRIQDNLTIRDFSSAGVIRADLDELRINEAERKSICIQGPSGIGKSTWAKREAPKPALWVTHLDNLKAFDSTIHKSIIFDDMSFLHIPREAQIHLVDNDDTRSIHIRYGVATIPEGTRKIFTSNGPIFSTDPAIGRRIINHIYS